MRLMKKSNFQPFLSSFFDDDFMTDFYNGSGNYSPAVNISETDKEFKIELAVPGMKKEDFKINLDNDQLIISAERSEENEEKEAEYTRREFRSASFQRSFNLPENKVREDKINAAYKDGILNITLPKKEEREAPSKLIEIK